MHRRVARIWKRGGGYFDRVRSAQTTSTRIVIALESVSHGLHENWDEISRKPRKFKGFFRPKSGGLQNKKKKKKGLHRFWDLRLIFWPKSQIQRFFSPKIRWSPKQKKIKQKGLHRFWDWFFGRNLKFKGVFFAQNQVVSKKKKKKVFTDWDWLFGTTRDSKRLRGAVFNFSPKIDLKTTKMVRFCILHKPMGGLEPPAPPWLRYWMCTLCTCAPCTLKFFRESSFWTLALAVALIQSLPNYPTTWDIVSQND